MNLARIRSGPLLFVFGSVIAKSRSSRRDCFWFCFPALPLRSCQSSRRSTLREKSEQNIGQWKNYFVSVGDSSGYVWTYRIFPRGAGIGKFSGNSDFFRAPFLELQLFIRVFYRISFTGSDGAHIRSLRTRTALRMAVLFYLMVEVSDQFIACEKISKLKCSRFRRIRTVRTIVSDAGA